MGQFIRHGGGKMLKQFINVIKGPKDVSVSTSAPATLDSPVQTNFKAFLGNLLPMLGGNGGAISPSAFVPQAFNGNQAVAAYQNNVGKNNKGQALAPGSAIVNAFGGGQQVPPQPINGGFVQPGFPVQGGTNQFGQPLNPNLNGVNGFAPQAPVGGLLGAGGGMLGNIQLFIGPVIGLFGLLKSLIGIRKITSALKPVESNFITTFSKTNDAIDQYEYEEGSFDNIEPRFEEEDTIDTNKLSEY